MPTQRLQAGIHVLICIKPLDAAGLHPHRFALPAVAGGRGESAKPFTIRVAGECLRVPADAMFNIEHEWAGDAQALEFQLLWKAGQD